MQRMSFGKTENGEETSLFILSGKGIKAAVTDYGASLVSVWVQDQNGETQDVILGYDSAEGYEKGTNCFGATVGRSCNRLKNAEFSLNGEVWNLKKNEGNNNLHSGPCGYDKRIWNAKVNGETVTFSLYSPHLDQGYPGNLKLSVTYSLTEEKGIEIRYEGDTDRDTILNPTNHAYFNLSGDPRRDVLDHVLMIRAGSYTVSDEEAIPTGEIRGTAGTPYDFSFPKPVGKDIESVRENGSYNLNYVIDGYNGTLRSIAKVFCKRSGISMEVFTDLPGVMFYDSFYMGEGIGKKGLSHRRYSGFCLETQFFPDAIHHRNFPQPVLKAGDHFYSVTRYRFDTTDREEKEERR